MKIKILTHRISLITGSCYADFEDVKSGDRLEASIMKKAIKNGEYDTENFAIRMRKYPTSEHLKTVKLQDSAKWGIC
jgi:hypothetical protein